MPVLPEVGSTSVVTPGVISPRRSASSIIASPMRSFTDPSGLKNSSLRASLACSRSAAISRGSRTSGVAPTVSRMLPYMRPRAAGRGSASGVSTRSLRSDLNTAIRPADLSRLVSMPRHFTPSEA